MKKIAQNDDDICKLLAFQGIFEILSEIMSEEDTVIVRDCCELMKTLLTDFNKNYIREIPSITRTVFFLLDSPNKIPILEFLFLACTNRSSSIHLANQKHFSILIPKIFETSYPSSGDQSLPALKLLKVLLQGNSGEIEAFAHADYSDTLDCMLTYCALGANYRENAEILGIFISGCKQIAENFISRVTCMPNYIEVPGSLGVFNNTLLQIFNTKHELLPSLCRTLEQIIFSNNSAKQLAVHLPIDLHSGTLLTKVFSLLIESMFSLTSNIKHLSSLLIVWLHESAESASKLLNSAFNSLPTILKFLENPGFDQSLIALVLGLLCLHNKSSDLDGIIMKTIGYAEFRSKLEYTTQTSEFKKSLNSQNIGNLDDYYSQQLVKVYQPAVQAVIMHFVKGIAESAPEDQKQLAKLFEVHEAYSSMQYLRNKAEKGDLDEDSCRRIRDFEMQVEEKNAIIEDMKVEMARSKHKQRQEIRSNVIAVIGIQEKFENMDFENLSLKRENANLHAKVERLLEEIKTMSTKKHEVHSDLKLIEAKENLRVVMTENTHLKALLQRKDSEINDALELIGKLESQNTRIAFEIPEIEILAEVPDKKVLCLEQGERVFCSQKYQKFENDVVAEKIQVRPMTFATVSIQAGDSKLKIKPKKVKKEFYNSFSQTEIIQKPPKNSRKNAILSLSTDKIEKISPEPVIKTFKEISNENTKKTEVAHIVQPDIKKDENDLPPPKNPFYNIPFVKQTNTIGGLFQPPKDNLLGGLTKTPQTNPFGSKQVEEENKMNEVSGGLFDSPKEEIHDGPGVVWTANNENDDEALMFFQKLPQNNSILSSFF